jgi:hypothetical protein
MSKQKSAVEQFAEQLASKNLLGIYTYDEMVLFDDLLNQFKEMEKERIEKDYMSGYSNGGLDTCITPKQYYEHIYGGNK